MDNSTEIPDEQWEEIKKIGDKVSERNQNSIDEDMEKMFLFRGGDMESELYQLSKLSPIEYETERAAFAKKHKIRASVLDKAVKDLQLNDSNQNDEVVTTDEPYYAKVNGESLLSTIEYSINKHMVLPVGALTPITLWIVLTYVYDAFRVLPKLSIISPEKRCGKSTLLDIISGLCSRSLLASNITPAAIFRVIEALKPSLLIDEADTFIAGRNDDMIGIINSGHTKNTAKVIRLVGDNHDAKVFSTFCPMALASIKSLPGTVMDRSIEISLRRRMAGEKVERLSIDFKDDSKVLRSKLLKWTKDNFTKLKTNPIEPPEIPNDRAIDNWLPLFTIANAIGGEWPEKVESAYYTLNSMAEEETASIMLLKDIKGVFETRERVKIFSNDLVDELIKLEERPWCEWKKGKAMTQNSLSKILKTFQIHSKQIRIGTDKKRGFELKQFHDAFLRYIPAPLIQSGTTVQTKQGNGYRDIQGGTNTEGVPLRKQLEPKLSNVCTTVPLQNLSYPHEFF